MNTDFWGLASEDSDFTGLGSGPRIYTYIILYVYILILINSLI